MERLTTSNHQLQQQMATMNGSYLALQGQMGQLQTEYQERVQRLENELGISQQHRVRGGRGRGRVWRVLCSCLNLVWSVGFQVLCFLVALQH